MAASERPVEADSLTTSIVNLVRQGAAATRPDLRRVTGLGRAVVDDRVAQAIRAGVLTDDDFVPSSGGRPSRRLRFRAEAGTVHAIDLGTNHVGVAVSDLDGRVLAHESWPRGLLQSPESVMDDASAALARLAAQTATNPVPWGIGMSMPGPVDSVRGRSQSAWRSMIGWEEFDLKGWWARRCPAPFWVENDINLLVRVVREARGETDEGDVVLVKVSLGIGAGILADGHLHRGRHGAAGGIGHLMINGASEVPVLCQCGQYDCLEAHAGGWALGRDAADAARAGRSEFLAARLAEAGELTVYDVIEGARRSDAVSYSLIERSATLVGEALATMIAFFDPGLIYLCGVLPDFGDIYRAIVRRVALQRSFPLTSVNLAVEHVRTDDRDGVRGAVGLVLDRLFDPDEGQLWFGRIADSAASVRSA